MTDEDKAFLIDVIEKQVADWWVSPELGSAEELATRIANAIESEFALITYKEQGHGSNNGN